MQNAIYIYIYNQILDTYGGWSDQSVNINKSGVFFSLQVW